jgi:hypothetical protein
MARLWIDNRTLKSQLATFFSSNKKDLSDFGNTVNQTFEAFVFASVVQWYARNGWAIEFKHPKRSQRTVKLKFSTRGRPDNYTYAICTSRNQKIQIRHQIRVATRFHKANQDPPANVVLDIAVLLDQDLSKYSSYDYADNSTLVTFGEAKHMSAFAELVAGFIGLVHELKPDVLQPVRRRKRPIPSRMMHPAPFLYVSGFLLPTAQGMVETIKRRGYDVDIYDFDTGATLGLRLQVMPAPSRVYSRVRGRVTS